MRSISKETYRRSVPDKEGIDGRVTVQTANGTHQRDVRELDMLQRNSERSKIIAVL